MVLSATVGWFSFQCPGTYCSVEYRIAAKYSNNSVFQHSFKEGCRITSWKDLMRQRAHDQGAAHATVRWRIWYHLAKLHVCEIRKAFEYLQVIRKYTVSCCGPAIINTRSEICVMIDTPHFAASISEGKSGRAYWFTPLHHKLHQSCPDLWKWQGGSISHDAAQCFLFSRNIG